MKLRLRNYQIELSDWRLMLYRIGPPDEQQQAVADNRRSLEEDPKDMDTSSTIPLTKLLPPYRAQGTLERAPLIDQIHHSAMSKRLTLLAAPAGAGKTTAVVNLHVTYPALPFAWVTLDEGDNDPRAFLALLIAAIQRHVAGFGHQLQHILETGSDDASLPLRLRGALINEFIGHLSDTFIIVLDDLHRVSDPIIHQLLDYLLEHMPPLLHLIITTRHDPPLRLAQLRVRGQLAEFRLEALRFSQEEVADLFHEVMQLSLTSPELQLIQARTDGWAAAVRLLMLSLPWPVSDDPHRDLVQHLSTTHHVLFDYLSEEVLQQRPPHIREFLLRSAILDELTPARCNAVTRRSDAAAVLDELYRQNLFLSIIETTDPIAEPTYRYHVLFAQFLRNVLQQRPASSLAKLHLLAAGVEPIPEWRVKHLLAAQAWEEAMAAIIAIGKAQCNREFIQQQVIDWISALPVHVFAHAYWPALIKASYLRQKGQISAARQLSKAALPVAQAQDDVAGEMEAMWTLSFFTTTELEPQWGIRLAELIAQRPDLLSPARYTFYLMSKAWRAFAQGDWGLAEQHFHEYLQTVRTTNDTQVYFAASQHIGPQWLFTESGLALISQFDRETLHMFGDGDGLVQAGLYMREGWRQLLQGNLNAAEALGQHAGRIARSFGSFAFMDLVADWILLVGMVARAEFARLEVFVQEAELRLLKVETHRQNLPAYWFSLWRACWLQDRWDDAQALKTRCAATLQQFGIEENPAIAIMEGWQAYMEKRSSHAEAMLLEARRRHRKLRWIGTWGNAGLDLALFYLLENRREEALSAWREAATEMKGRHMPGQPLFTGRKIAPLLELAVKENLYPEIAQDTLAAFRTNAAPHAIAIPGSDEMLTPREAEVLRLLMNGATNQAIAAQLVITERTAKAHVSNILQKLQVSSRSEAITRAHALSLLSSSVLSSR
jgi:LuxR family transcriptional regulator, maltose regulon positive regulatory protein